MFDGSSNGGPRLSDRVDWRVAVPLALLGVSVVLALAADQAVFAHPPRNGFERLLAIPVTLLYRLTEDRLTAAVLSGVIILAVTLIAGLAAFLWIERHVLTPIQIKKMVETTQLEEKLVNRFRDEGRR